jgi:3-oxoacid CoA-transferase subunit A
MNKTYASAIDAVIDIASGSSLAVGGFGLCGIPHALIEALLAQGAGDLETVSNNCGVDGGGLGLLLEAHRIRRTTGSYVGENLEFARQYLSGELELCPQGTLAERLRAGGCGIPAFYTPAGVGTLVADGGLPWRYAADGSVALASPPKEVRRFGADERMYVLEMGIVTDFALVRAARGDRHGNLSYDASARNFNPLVAMAGRITIAEVEELVEPGKLDPEHIDTPGVFVQRVVAVGETGKQIERRTTRARPAESPGGTGFPPAGERRGAVTQRAEVL